MKGKLTSPTGISVLSLFDGMGCGRLALDRAGIPVANYFAAEVDKFAIRVTTAKWPGIIHLGDVVLVKAALCWCYKTRKKFYSSPYISESTKTAFQEIHNIFLYVKIDLLIGGSPCQGFSFAGKGLNFNDPRSRLFFEFVKIKNELQRRNPSLIFLLENVVMAKRHQNVITRCMGIAPVLINSKFVSAQNRKRLYWTNVCTAPAGLFSDVQPNIPPPPDKKIVLKHVLQQDVAAKYYLIDAALARVLKKQDFKPQINPDIAGTINTKNNSPQSSFDNGTTLIDVSEKAFSLTASYSKGVSERNAHTVVKLYFDGNLANDQDKASTLQVGGHGAGNHSGVDLIAPPLLGNDYAHPPQILTQYRIRRLTPIECCRLQTVPDDYFFDTEGNPIVSETQMYKMLGNGWTVDVIVHILKQGNFYKNNLDHAAAIYHHTKPIAGILPCVPKLGKTSVRLSARAIAQRVGASRSSALQNRTRRFRKLFKPQRA